MTPLFRFLFEALDQRLLLQKTSREIVNKVSPRHWSFLLGEVALFSFVILVATGLFLAMFYRPTADPVVYSGSSELYAGRMLPAAFASIVELSHDVAGGLLFRRLHRGAAYLFVFSTVAHLLRVLLTGAFRRPREFNTHIGTVMLMLVIALAYTGQTLPYDLLAGSSLRITYAALASVPYVGEHLIMSAFGGTFPSQVVARLYVMHVLVLPGLLAGLLVAHLVVVARQGHTQPPRPGIDPQRSIVGEPLWPGRFAAATTLVLVVGGVLTVFAVLVPWSDVDLQGPLRLGHTTNAAHPEWWLFWVQGAITIFPGFEWTVAGTTLSHMFAFNVVLPLVVFALLFAYPFVERRLAPYDPTVDSHLCTRPLDLPVRAGLVLGGASFIGVLTAATTSELIAIGLRVPIETVIWVFRVAVLAVPAFVGWVAHARATTLQGRRVESGRVAETAGSRVLG